MKYFLSFFILGFVGIGSILATNLFSIDYMYDYTYFTEKINISSLHSGAFQEHHFSTPRTTLVLSLDPQDIAGYDHEDIQIEWKVGDTRIIRDIDTDDGSEVFTTFPVILPQAIQDVSFRIIGMTPRLPVDIVSFDLRPRFGGISWHPDSLYAADDAIHIIRRSEWGANESYRFQSDSYRVQKQQELAERGGNPKIVYETSSQKEKRESIDREILRIRADDPESYEIQTLSYMEGAKKLRYPTRTTKKVNKIILHHTAEDLDTTLDDATLVRNIYAYHAQVKGWSDIAYHYLVGQRGDIYEGRAGGDYVEGFHAYGNNLGTVGVSVIGNYDTNHLNRDQKQGIERIVLFLVKKYGINPSGTAIGMKQCGSSEGCSWKRVVTPTIIGHRDVSYTACPGKNLYAYLPELRNIIVGKVGNISPVLNSNIKSIQDIPLEDRIKYRIQENIPAVSPVKIPVQYTPSNGGKKIKVRLSYTGTSIILDNITSKQPIVKNGVKKIQFLTKDSASIGVYGKDQLSIRIGMKSYTGRIFSIEGDILRVASWQRIPSWDTAKKYNDNLFRGKLIVRNEGGNLLLINEIPIEDYLRGMGEMSESDAKSHPEKSKSIIVAARSYALYYADLNLPYRQRKFPGKPYDISDNPDESQQYKGYSYELRSPTVASLVSFTRGEVVTQSGKILKVPYSQSPGRGKTYSYLEYCTERGGKSCADISYLQSVDDPGSINTKRSGHGYGVSGVGSMYFDTQGWDYKKILKYYLTGVEIQKK